MDTSSGKTTTFNLHLFNIDWDTDGVEDLGLPLEAHVGVEVDTDSIKGASMEDLLHDLHQEGMEILTDVVGWCILSSDCSLIDSMPAVAEDVVDVHPPKEKPDRHLRLVKGFKE